MKTISRYIMTLALLLTAATGAWAEDTYTVTFKANGKTKTVENVTLPHTFELDPIIIELYPSLSGGNGSPAGTSASGNTNVTAYYNNNKHYATISASFEGAVTVTGQFFKDFTNNQYTLEINCMENLVAISDDKTEATIKMPTSDVTVNYELVRDMSVQMTATMGNGTDGVRYRVKKNEQTGKYQPADMDMMQVLGLVAVNDGIEQKTLTLNQDYYCRIYKLDEQTQQPAGDGVLLADFDFAPGLYALKAFAEKGSNYDGETALSNTFVLFEGYEVVIPVGEYITYYKDEAVRLEEKDMNDIELCTITAVEDGKAVLSNNFDAMKANTPFLLKNTTHEEKTILLIPCNEPNLAVTVAEEFKGTEGPRDFSEAEMADGDFYVCNGKEFVKVRGKGTLAANKAFLFVEGNNAPASIPFRRSIDGGEGTTGVDLIDNGKLIIDNDGWYDLNGRRLQGKPSQKGVYIKNGK
ncbi:MAG: hypothetical protein II949_03285, partial [Prevotella sp.]|nr:hypothetical protein [Prevotella sp.]